MALLKPGTRARDKITGFEGTVTAWCQELSGAHQYRIEGLVPAGRTIPGAIRWFDAFRVESIDTQESATPVHAADEGKTDSSQAAAAERKCECLFCKPEGYPVDVVFRALELMLRARQLRNAANAPTNTTH